MKNAPLYKLHMEPLARSVEHFTGDYMVDKFDLNPPYQRGSVWDLPRRQNLIRSLRLGIPIGSILINNRGYGAEVPYAVVDGKQRVETLRAFVASEFGAPAHWFEARELLDPSAADGDATVTYEELTDIGKRGFKNCIVPSVEACVNGLEAEAEMFLLINTAGVEQEQSTLDAAGQLAAR